ncbi:MFS transporter [uncultured Ruthenibacterium sp.]|uniref:MFS transporter n=1 Tax=uncultured Ruthenibacterium sp. TaxID=1905347 RepID=UPI00349EE39B
MDECESARLVRSQRLFWGENAVAGVIASLCTGNFLTGYLSWLGADAGFCALIGSLPQFGCVLQLVSPLLFERLSRRKPVIFLMCFLFRFSLGFSILTPLLFGESKARLTFIFILYFVAYLAAGFVTPALNQWVMDIAPSFGRGKYFARRDMLSAGCNALAGLAMGWQLDCFVAFGQPLIGFSIVFGTAMVLAVVDAVLLASILEKPCVVSHVPCFRGMWEPLGHAKYKKVVLYMIFWYFSTSLATPFLTVYLIQYMGLSYTFLSSMTVETLLFSLVGNWLFGTVADRAGWKRVLLMTNALTASAYLGWTFINTEIVLWAAPLLYGVQSVCTSACAMAALNLQYNGAPPTRRTTYMGTTAAIGSAFSYAATLLGSCLQRSWEPMWGGQSIAVLFAVASVCNGLCLVYGIFCLENRSNVSEKNSVKNQTDDGEKIH